MKTFIIQSDSYLSVLGELNKWLDTYEQDMIIISIIIVDTKLGNTTGTVTYILKL